MLVQDCLECYMSTDDRTAIRRTPRWGWVIALAANLVLTRFAFPQDEKAKTEPAGDAATAEAAQPPAPATETAETPPSAAPPSAAPQAAATDPAAGDTTVKPPQSLLSWIFEAEGIFFVPQLGISILLVFMIVFYSLQMRGAQFVPREFVQGFENLIRDKKYNDAYDLARKDESLIGKMLGAGLGRVSVGYQQAIEAMEEVVEDESMRHDHRLSYLSMIANVATLVGLLGTVWGMVGSFRVIASSAVAPKPNELATGVSQALVTTVWGLLQAIPAIIAYTYLRNRVSRSAFEAGTVAEQLMSRLSGTARRPATPGAATP